MQNKSLQQASRDHGCLYFGGPFEDVQNARIAKDAADPIF
jgi:hypothetical protein